MDTGRCFVCGQEDPEYEYDETLFCVACYNARRAAEEQETDAKLQQEWEKGIPCS